MASARLLFAESVGNGATYDPTSRHRRRLPCGLRRLAARDLRATCSLKHGPWRLLVDTDTDECWPSLKARLARLPVVDGTRHIDLAVITHIDHDHIGTAGLMLSDTSLGLKFGDIWFNAPPQPEARGVKEGGTLASILGGKHADLEALANKITATDRAPANGSSIAILLEHRGASVLLCADAHPTVLAPALRALAVHRRLPAPL